MSHIGSYCFIFSHSGINYPGQTIISFLPLFHIYGLVVLGSVIHCIGVKLVIMSKFGIDEYLGLVQKYKVTYMILLLGMELFVQGYSKKKLQYLDILPNK